MGSVAGPNRAKIARRVIEVFEFLGQNDQQAKVTSIARRYGWPQSSTSELLSSLVEMGLLYKDLRSRIYSPTPRLASLGSFQQPELIREGGLFPFMNRLAQTTGKTVILFGVVGMHVQIFHLSPGMKDAIYNIRCGTSELLSSSAAGLLLLSTFSTEQASRVLWRLHCESPERSKLNLPATGQYVARYRQQKYAVGDAGFIPGLSVAVTLLTRPKQKRPLALGILYSPELPFDTEEILAQLNYDVAPSRVASGMADQIPPVSFRKVG